MNETTTSFIVKFEGATYFGADNLAKTLNLVTNTIYDITNAADSEAYFKDQIPSQINNNNNGTFDVVNQNGSTMNISIDTMNVFPIIDKELSEIAEIAENENREGIRLQSEFIC